MSREKKRIKSVACHNCNKPFADEHQNYCAYCGQENHTHKLPIGHFVLELIESLTHFDTKFFQTFTDLVWKPGLVIKNYNDDKRARYFPPVRIYFFTSFIFFLILTVSFQKNLDSASESFSTALKNNRKDTSAPVKINIQGLDSLELKEVSDIPNLTLEKIDSFFISKHKPSNGWYGKRILLTLVKIRNGELTLAEIFHKFIKYFSYALFILMPLFALLLKFFYRKRNYFYSEFLVFSIYFHTFIFGVLSIFILLEKVFNFKFNLLPLILLFGIGVYLGISLKRVFEDSISKILLKTTFLALIYFLCLLVIFSILLVGSFV